MTPEFSSPWMNKENLDKGDEYGDDPVFGRVLSIPDTLPFIQEETVLFSIHRESPPVTMDEFKGD